MNNNRAVVRSLAGVYDTEAAARTALRNIHYPATSIPPWDKPELFWSEVIQSLEKGLLEDGIGRLVMGAAQEFPANRGLQALADHFRGGRRPTAAQHNTATPADQGWPRPGSELREFDGLTGERLPLTGPPETPDANITMPARKRFRLRNIKRRREPHIFPSSLRGFEFRPTRRFPEPAGTEEYNFDNSGSSATSVETLHISNSIQIVTQFDIQRATLHTGQASGGLMDFAKIEGQLRSALRSRLSLSGQTTLTIERKSEIHIPAYANVIVTLRWKRIWEEGIVSLFHPPYAA